MSTQRLLDRERSLILFRIAQEALRNVAKHAGASKTELAVAVKDSELAMQITDDGRGFDAADIKRLRGLGLVSMAERARLADGNFNVWSNPGRGTTIRVTVPLRA